MSPRMEDTPEDLLKQEGKQSLIREVLDLRAQVETLTAERDEAQSWATAWHRTCETICTIVGLSPALGAVEAVTAVRSQFEAAEARALASDTARASAETALAEAREALKAIAEGCSFPEDDVQRACRDRARAALEQKAMITKPAPALTSQETFLLKWLGDEDSSALGECEGQSLDVLVNLGLAAIGPTPTGQHPHYRRVSLTDAGRAALEQRT